MQATHMYQTKGVLLQGRRNQAKQLFGNSLKPTARLACFALVVCRPSVSACACCGQGASVSSSTRACAGALERCRVGAAAERALSRVGGAVGAGDCRGSNNGVSAFVELLLASKGASALLNRPHATLGGWHKRKQGAVGLSGGASSQPAKAKTLTCLALVAGCPYVGCCTYCGQSSCVPTATCACACALERCRVGATGKRAASWVGRAVGAGDCSRKREHGMCEGIHSR
jgi:hypothetical protein